MTSRTWWCGLVSGMGWKLEHLALRKSRNCETYIVGRSSKAWKSFQRMAGEENGAKLQRQIS